MEKREQQLAYEFGAFFRSERKRNNMSQVELSKILGMSQSRMSKVEQGKLVLNIFEFFKFAKRIGINDISKFL